MNWSDVIGFSIIGFVVVFAVLFITVCAFDEMMEKSLKSEGCDECNSEEIERNVTKSYREVDSDK